MPRLFFLAYTTLAIAGCGSAPSCATVDAQGIADVNGSQAQFRAMLEGVVQRTVTAAMVAKRDGAAGSQALSKAIEIAVGRHQAEWDRNVVASWNTLASGEIEQVCAAFASRDRATYMRFATRVGEEAKKRNEPVLQQAATDVVATVFQSGKAQR
jgi:hypothetical protein